MLRLCGFFAGLIILCNHVSASNGIVAANQAAFSIKPPRSVSDFLTSGGRIDLNAIRLSGYQGTLDLKGVDVRIDPRNGAPIVRAASSQTSADNPDDVYWDWMVRFGQRPSTMDG